MNQPRGAPGSFSQEDALPAWIPALAALGLRLPPCLERRRPILYAFAAHGFSVEQLPLYRPDRVYLRFEPGALLAVFRSANAPRDVSKTWYKGVVVPPQATQPAPAKPGERAAGGAAGGATGAGGELTYGWFPSTFVVSELQALSRHLVYGIPYEMLLEAEQRCYPRFLQMIGEYMIQNDLPRKPGAFRESNRKEKQEKIERLLASRREFAMEDLLDEGRTQPEFHLSRMFKKFLEDMRDPIIPYSLWRSFAPYIPQVLMKQSQASLDRKVDLVAQLLLFYLPMSRQILLRCFMDLTSRISENTGAQKLSLVSRSDMYGMYLVRDNRVWGDSGGGSSGSSSKCDVVRHFMIENWAAIESRMVDHYHCPLPPLDLPLEQVRFSYSFPRPSEEVLYDFAVEPEPPRADLFAAETPSSAGGPGAVHAAWYSRAAFPASLAARYPGTPVTVPLRQHAAYDPAYLTVRRGDRVNLLTVVEGWAFAELCAGGAVRRGWLPYSCLACSRDLLFWLPGGRAARARSEGTAGGGAPTTPAAVSACV